MAVGAYEAETNIIIHSVGGEIIAEVRPDRLKITAIDNGPGISDIEQAMEPGFSTAPIDSRVGLWRGHGADDQGLRGRDEVRVASRGWNPP